MQETEPESESRINPKRIFMLLFYAFLSLIGIMILSVLILLILQGGEYRGFFYVVLIVVSSLPVFWMYVKNVRSPPRLIEKPELELYGNLESMAAMVRRASKGYDYSRDKLDEALSELLGRECHLQGSGSAYLEALEDMLKEV